MTLAIAHQDRGRIVLDRLCERPAPFSPEAVVADFAAVLKAYRVSTVEGDRYGGEWPREAFRRHGVAYTLAERTRSEIYRDLLPLLNSGRVALLDDPTLIAQLVGLERRTSRGGRDLIDHAPNAYDMLRTLRPALPSRRSRLAPPTPSPRRSAGGEPGSRGSRGACPDGPGDTRRCTRGCADFRR